MESRTARSGHAPAALIFVPTIAILQRVTGRARALARTDAFDRVIEVGLTLASANRRLTPQFTSVEHPSAQTPRHLRHKPADPRADRCSTEVICGVKYDGSPVLKVRGIFVAGLATHPSAEPETLVVRADMEDREWLIADAPDTYYLTDYYRKYPLILVRLQRIDRSALRDLLSVSRGLALAKARGPTPGARRRGAPTRA